MNMALGRRLTTSPLGIFDDAGYGRLAIDSAAR